MSTVGTGMLKFVSWTNPGQDIAFKLSKIPSAVQPARSFFTLSPELLQTEMECRKLIAP